MGERLNSSSNEEPRDPELLRHGREELGVDVAGKVRTMIDTFEKIDRKERDEESNNDSEPQDPKPQDD